MVKLVGVVGTLMSILGPATIAHAKKPKRTQEPSGPCDRMRPNDELTSEQHESLNTALNASFMGIGGGGNLGSSSGSATTRKILGDDALEKAWFTYQACLLKEAGVLDDASARNLVLHLMGMPPEPAEPSPLESIADAGALAPVHGGSQLRLVVLGTNSQAEVALDGSARGAIGSGLQVQAVPGHHTLEASQRGYRRHVSEIDLTFDGQIYTIPSLKKKKKWIPWVIAGSVVVAAAAGGGIAAAVAASQAYDDGGGGGGGKTTTPTTYTYTPYTYYYSRVVCVRF